MDSTTVSPKETRLNDAANEFIELRDAFISEEIRRTEGRILSELVKHRELMRHRHSSAKVLLNDWCMTERCIPADTRFPDVIGAAEDYATCLNSLNAIPMRREVTVIPFAEKIPQYTSWFPVNRMFRIDTPADVYMPYFGTSDTDKEKALRAFYMMVDEDQGKKPAIELPSDGEVDEKEKCFVPPDPLEEMNREHTLGDIRLRAAQRWAILHVMKKYGCRKDLLRPLTEKLGLSDVLIVEAIHSLAEGRAIEHDKNMERLKRAKRKALDIRTAISKPNCPSEVSGSEIILNVLNNFCHVCHVFMCDLHDTTRPVPQVPIADEAAAERLTDIHFRSVKPCSQRCCFLKAEEQSPSEQSESQGWTAEEMELLREATQMYRRDPCSISIVIGTRCCREVGRRLPRYLMTLEDTCKQHSKIRSDFQSLRVRGVSGYTEMMPHHSYSSENDDEPLSAIRSKRARTNVVPRGVRKSSASGSIPRGNQGSSESEDESLWETRSRRSGKRGGAKTARKSAVAREKCHEDLGHWAFQPCCHSGPCDSTKNCSCVKNGRLCEAFCGCNKQRFGFSQRTRSIVQTGDECTNTANFCNCPGGNCDPLECPCSAEYGKTCNPEKCSCDCRLDPGSVSISGRNCKNCDILRHKRTFVGRSSESGFGLFAGDSFEKGDLIGTYIGALLPANIVDGTCAVGEVTEKLYTFDIRNVTVDGTKLGAKARFINHREEWESPNCKASEVQVNGHWYQRLTTLRTVEPGEEFFFDYKIVDPSGRSDCAYTLPGWLKDRRENQIRRNPGV